MRMHDPGPGPTRAESATLGRPPLRTAVASRFSTAPTVNDPGEPTTNSECPPHCVYMKASQEPVAEPNPAARRARARRYRGSHGSVRAWRRSPRARR